MNYYIFVLGCQYNYYDATRIAHLLEKMGYVLSSEKDADIIIVLSCSVRQKGIDRIFGKIKNWHKLPQCPKIIITACILDNDKKKLADKVDIIIDSKNIEIELEKWLNHQTIKLSEKSSSSLANKQFNSFLPCNESKDIAYIPIMQGCDNFCTYCAVPYTRGREVSRSEKEIMNEIKNQLNNGYKKILLLGQNVNSFGLRPKVTSNKLNVASNKIPFSKLLEKIDQINGNFKYNFMSSNPHDFTDDLIKTLSKSTKWEKVLHLPLQSGDDEILKKMNRKYTSNQYLSLIENCKLKIPASPAGGKNLSVTTDIIVGFPSETNQQFQNTIKLCKKIGFSKVYVSQYSPRPQTVSAKTMLDDVTKEEKKRRWQIINNLINKNK